MATKIEQNIAQWEKTNRCRLICKRNSELMLILDVVLIAFDIENFGRMWTALRLPFGEDTIYYPDHVEDPTTDEHLVRRKHEMIHVVQQTTAWGLFKTYVLYTVAPLPIYWSGRWDIEFPAYMIDIRAGIHTPESAAKILFENYLRPRPYKWMVDRFTQELENNEGDV